MGAGEFRSNAESGEVPVDCQILQMAFLCLDHGLWNGNGVFDVIDKLCARGCSFGPRNLRFNRYDFRTRETPYPGTCASAGEANYQKGRWTCFTSPRLLAAGIYRSSNQYEGDLPSADNFDAFCAQHYPLLHQDAW